VVKDYFGPGVGEFVVSLQGEVDFSPRSGQEPFPTSIGGRLGIPLVIETLRGEETGDEWRGAEGCAPLLRASDHNYSLPPGYDGPVVLRDDRKETLEALKTESPPYRFLTVSDCG